MKRLSHLSAAIPRLLCAAVHANKVSTAGIPFAPGNGEAVGHSMGTATGAE